MIRFGCMLFPLNGFFINCMPSVVLGGNVPFSILFLTKIPIEPKLFSSTYLFILGQLTSDHAFKRCYYFPLHRYVVSRDVTFQEYLMFSSGNQQRLMICLCILYHITTLMQFLQHLVYMSLNNLSLLNNLLTLPRLQIPLPAIISISSNVQ